MGTGSCFGRSHNKCLWEKMGVQDLLRLRDAFFTCCLNACTDVAFDSLSPSCISVFDRFLLKEHSGAVVLPYSTKLLLRSIGSGGCVPANNFGTSSASSRACQAGNAGGGPASTPFSPVWRATLWLQTKERGGHWNVEGWGQHRGKNTSMMRLSQNMLPPNLSAIATKEKEICSCDACRSWSISWNRAKFVATAGTRTFRAPSWQGWVSGV